MKLVKYYANDEVSETENKETLDEQLCSSKISDIETSTDSNKTEDDVNSCVYDDCLENVIKYDDEIYIHQEEGFNGTNYYHAIEYTIEGRNITIRYAKQSFEQGDIVTKEISDDNYKGLINVLNKYYNILNQTPRDNAHFVFDSGHDSWDYRIAKKSAENVSMLFSCDDNFLWSSAFNEYKEVIEKIIEG